MVNQVKQTGATPVKYVPVTFSSENKKTIVISFPKGTDFAVDDKFNTLNKATAMKLDAKHYEALLKADATGDKKIDKADAKALLAKKEQAGMTATPFAIGVKTNPKNQGDDRRIGVFFQGYQQYNNSQADGP